jgi:hypothetical protein
MSLSLKNDIDHIKFVEKMIRNACTAQEKNNYESYFKAIKSGMLEGHQGRFVYIANGKLLNQSFKFAHEIIDHINFLAIHESDIKLQHESDCSNEILFNNATFLYVPALNRLK